MGLTCFAFKAAIDDVKHSNPVTNLMMCNQTSIVALLIRAKNTHLDTFAFGAWMYLLDYSDAFVAHGKRRVGGPEWHSEAAETLTRIWPSEGSGTATSFTLILLSVFAH